MANSYTPWGIKANPKAQQAVRDYQSVPGQTGGAGTVAMPDVENYISQYERGLAPYYQMAGQRYKQAIQRQLGQSQRQLGEQYQARGMYGTGLYGRGIGNLYQQAMQDYAGGAQGLEMQRQQEQERLDNERRNAAMAHQVNMTKATQPRAGASGG